MGLGKIAISFAMELKDDCVSYMNIYAAYCGMEAFHVLFDIIIRTIMLVEMFRIRKVWDCTLLKDYLYDNVNQNLSINSTDKQESITKLLAAKNFRENLLQYHERGKEAKYLMHPFKLWFLTPWLIYSVETSLNPNSLLSPWTESDSTIEDLTKWFHIVNVAMKTFQLLLQYIFALKINESHRDYYLKMKLEVVFKFKYDKVKSEGFKQDYLAEASQLMATVEFQDDFNFYPTFLGLNPRIPVDGPFFIFVLLLGVIINSSDKVSDGFFG